VERRQLLGALNEQENSPLWKGLWSIASKDKKHMDVEWRHVGFLHCEKDVADKQVFLFDLEHVNDLDPNERESWVGECYQKLLSTVDEQ
jgi:hypothetical protein